MKKNVALVYMNNENNVGRGIGYIAGSILREGHNLEFFDTLHTPFDEVVKQVSEKNFDSLMISTMTLMYPEAQRLAKEVKARKNIPILAGGIHPTIVREKVLEETPEIDHLCLGEGESFVVDYLNHLGKDTLTAVQNLAYRKNGKAVANPLRPAEDLSKLPKFPWHLFSENTIINKDLGVIYITSSRGCPFNCSYCSNIVYLKDYGRKYLRTRPTEHLIEELRELKQKYNPELFYFGDEMFLSDTSYALHTLREMKKEINVPYGFMARVEYVTPEVVKTLKETGCHYVAMGVECGDEEFRKTHLNRLMANDKIVEAFQMMKDAGIFTTTFNMIGYPVPDDDRLTQSTIDLNKRLKPDYVQVSIFYPFPGTKLYDKCFNEGLVDMDKFKNNRHYYEDSVLKGVTVLPRMRQMQLLFNSAGLDFALHRYRNSKKPATDPTKEGFLTLELKHLKGLIRQNIAQRPFLKKCVGKLKHVSFARVEAAEQVW